MTLRVRIAGLGLLLAALAVGSPAPAEAQFGKLKQKVKQRVDQKTDRAMEDAIDEADPTKAKTGATETAAAADSAAPESAAASGTETAAAAPAKTVKPGEGAWANFDFKPGERALFVDDLSKDEVGDFPRRMELKDGNFEIVEWQGGRYIRGTNFGTLYVPLPETLPERFTLEFDFAGPNGWNSEVYFVEDNEHTRMTFRPYEGGLTGGGITSTSQTGQELENKVFPIKLMVDGKYAKMYMGNKRVANAPNANLGRSNKIAFKVSASDDSPIMIGNIRVMAGGKKLYDALAEKGRVATQGIYFDTGSDRLRPESSATLKEIGTMLQEHADLKLTIEGHTDNVGAAAANQTLSEQRAEAVRQFLVTTYGIDAARLSAKGLGSTKPVAPNETPEGKQMNRRVELVKG